jgi:hypothetical protein
MLAAQVIDEKVTSDHCPVYAVLELLPWLFPLRTPCEPNQLFLQFQFATTKMLAVRKMIPINPNTMIFLTVRVIIYPSILVIVGNQFLEISEMRECPIK